MQITINRRTIEIGIAAVVVVLGIMWVGSTKAPENAQQSSDTDPQVILNDLNSATPKAQPTVQKTTPPPPPAPKPATGTTFKDYRNATYVLGGNSVSLTTGKSASGKTEILPAFEATGDLNNDKIYDVALVIKQTPESSPFFYLVAAIKNNNGYRITNAILIGENIEPINVGIGTGDISMVYLDRNPGEPTSAKPTVQRQKSFQVVSGVLKTR